MACAERWVSLSLNPSYGLPSPQRIHSLVRFGRPGAVRNGRSPSLAGHLVVHTLHVEVHAEDLAVLEGLAVFALHCLAVLGDDRAFERMQGAGDDGGL